MKKIKIPYYKQSDQEGCGAAAISMALIACGISIPQEEILHLILKKHNQSDKKNTFTHDMCSFLFDKGAYALYVGGLNDVKTWNLLKTYVRKGFPLIALQRYSLRNSRSHFRVITGHEFINEKHKIYFHDPIDGKDQSLMKDKFFDLWKHEPGSDQLRINELVVIKKKTFSIPETHCNFCQSTSIKKMILDNSVIPKEYSFINPSTKFESTCMQFVCNSCGVNYIFNEKLRINHNS